MAITIDSISLGGAITQYENINFYYAGVNRNEVFFILYFFPTTYKVRLICLNLIL